MATLCNEQGKVYILQSRPVTSLFPLPQESLDPLIIWFSFGTVQGMIGPMTPLGRDTILRVAAGAGRLFGVTYKDLHSDVMSEAGERIWIKVSDMLRNPIGSRVFRFFLGFIEPSVGQILSTLTADPRLGAGKGRLKFSTLRRLVRFFLPVAVGTVRTMLNPEKARARFEASLEDYLRKAQIVPGSDRYERLANITAYMQAGDRMANALPFALPRFLPVIAPAMGLMNFLIHFSGNEPLALEVTRGLPHNVTTQMDLALWQAAAAIKADAEAQAVFNSADGQTLAESYLAGKLPAAAQAAVKDFMDQYGMRGVGEIDFGQKRWREEPAPLMHTLQSYLQIDPAAAPDVQFSRSGQAAQAAVEQLAAQARRQPGGWLKEKMVRAAARRLRVLMGARESPKFFAIRSMGIARQVLLEAGQEFVSAGTLEQPDDLVFLRIAELDELAHANHQPSAAVKDWKGLISERRAVYGRELRRRQVPRVLVSDGRAFYEGVGAASDSRAALNGSPVSPGLVEGVVRVVLDPRSTSLAPGEILVCPGTDPAWTPLFMTAGGLITEVGGMMTHGSVVAREYGIPAVVGVDHATQRLHSGQRIRLNGTTGEVTLLADEAAAPASPAQIEATLR